MNFWNKILILIYLFYSFAWRCVQGVCRTSTIYALGRNNCRWCCLEWNRVCTNASTPAGWDHHLTRVSRTRVAPPMSLLREGRASARQMALLFRSGVWPRPDRRQPARPAHSAGVSSAHTRSDLWSWHSQWWTWARSSTHEFSGRATKLLWK